jgi:hypothetical protein
LKMSSIKQVFMSPEGTIFGAINPKTPPCITKNNLGLNMGAGAPYPRLMNLWRWVIYLLIGMEEKPTKTTTK